MTDKPWKTTERAIAKALGGKRVPVNGRAGADVSHPWLAIEVKHRQSIPGWLNAAMSQAKASANPSQLPVAVVHEAGAHHAKDLVVIQLSQFCEWFGDYIPEQTGENPAAGDGDN